MNIMNSYLYYVIVIYSILKSNDSWLQDKSQVFQSSPHVKLSLRMARHLADDDDFDRSTIPHGGSPRLSDGNLQKSLVKPMGIIYGYISGISEICEITHRSDLNMWCIYIYTYGIPVKYLTIE